jgi:hypothetical protein
MQRLVLIVAGLLLFAPVRAFAQCPPAVVPPDMAGECPAIYPSWTGELAVLGGNALLGGISAGVLHVLRGSDGSFGAAFVRGLAGGAVVYGGKRIATERFGGAGLVGRQVGAVGASMVRNAGEGRGVVSHIALPVGPVWLQLQAGAPRLSARLDLVATGWLVYGLLDPALRLDPGMSISAGTHVFVAENMVIAYTDTLDAHAVAAPGFIALGRVPAFGRTAARQAFEHERVHVLQMDQIFLTVTGPAERRVLEAVPGLRRAASWFEVNLSGFLLGALAGGFDEYVRKPWETEALFLSR